jgi:hypothetical protein
VPKSEDIDVKMTSPRISRIDKGKSRALDENIVDREPRARSSQKRKYEPEEVGKPQDVPKSSMKKVVKSAGDVEMSDDDGPSV